MAQIKIERSSNRRGHDWYVRVRHNDDGTFAVEESEVHTILLCEIRDELKKLNTLLHCHNFQTLPREIQEINRRLATTRKLTRRKARA